jgi:lipopolysaccharide/colanic/teichoic acid biosynthesis glycosyltransferase
LRCSVAMATTIQARPARGAIPFSPIALPRQVIREALSRRFVNLTAALVALAVTAPIMVVIAVLVKLTSDGPVFYTQMRIGVDLRGGRRTGAYGRRRTDLGGKPFTIYKFRTMRACPADAAPQVWAEEGDERVTRIGRTLRSYRLDELPQLLNVLVGDMNLVGPRPEQPAIFALLSTEIPGYRRRQLVRPGITGWAQVNQGYDHSLDDVRRKVEFDLEYIGRQSAIEDLRIMARTVPVVLFGRGAC